MAKELKIAEPPKNGHSKNSVKNVITPTNISHIERAQISPSLETLVKIANALEVGVDDLLCDSLTTAGTPIIENKLAALLSDCSDYEIKMLSEIISNLKSTIRKFNQNKSY